VRELFYGGSDTSMCTLVNSNIDEQSDRRIANKMNIQTLDSFCKEYGIKHINYLKIDTEGYDLNVLKGADRLYSNKAVDFIEVEAGMNPRNKYHVSFIDLKSFLEAKGYLMFGFTIKLMNGLIRSLFKKMQRSFYFRNTCE